ncbi:MAG: prepilin peptidase [Planctomycetes bacterium]|nr:prepilin peptidase [Planctomycetota bacterium]
MMISSSTEVVSLVGATVLGAVVGSFLNVVIHRLPVREQQRSRGARSACPHCGAPIPATLNLPIVSWLWLRGRARCCGARISARYPLVEALTAALFAMLAWLPPRPGLVPSFAELGSLAAFAFVVRAFFLADLVANTFIDLEFRILPDRLTKPLMVVGPLSAVLAPELIEPLPGFESVAPSALALITSLFGMGVGFGVTWAVRTGARLWLRKEAMGFGDVKLMAGIGAFLGWQGALMTFFLGCVLGSIAGSLRLFFVRDPYVAFGPFLAAGAVISLFFHADGIEFLTETWPRWQAEHVSSPWLIAGLGLLAAGALLILLRRRTT